MLIQLFLSFQNVIYILTFMDIYLYVLNYIIQYKMQCITYEFIKSNIIMLSFCVNYIVGKTLEEIKGEKKTYITF